jgi:hypothetical protein
MIELTAERLRELLRYDPETGVFLWLTRKARCIRVGDIAGSLHRTGYSHVCIDGRFYYAHRLAWLYVVGSWPSLHIDHIDGVRNNNRFSNLRDVDRCVNLQNQRKARNDNESGAIGVRVQGDRFRATISNEGATIHLGLFPTIVDASDAYLKAKRKLHSGCTI